MGIRLARFRGKDRLADFADNRQYWGHVFALLHRAESFLLDHVPIAGRVVSGKMIREDTGEAFEHYDEGVEHSLWLSLICDSQALRARYAPAW